MPSYFFKNIELDDAVNHFKAICFGNRTKIVRLLEVETLSTSIVEHGLGGE